VEPLSSAEENPAIFHHVDLMFVLQEFQCFSTTPTSRHKILFTVIEIKQDGALQNLALFSLLRIDIEFAMNVQPLMSVTPTR
jgi:hypothetical protein